MKMIGGLEVIITEMLVDHRMVRARTHRSKRIDKKWKKRYGFHRVGKRGDVMRFEDKLFMNKATYNFIRRGLNVDN